MKAVVMAGGEGTRLRPLTSNQPKPMVPDRRQAVHGAHPRPAQRHGFDEVVVTLAFMPQAIRGYFGDGEALGSTIHYSVEEQPLGTAGSVKLAERGARRAVPRHLRRRALRRRSDRARRASTASARALVTIGLKSRRQPARVRHRRHRRRRARRAVPREAVLGPGLLGHDQHGDLRARARGSPPRPDGPAVRLLEAALPASARDGPPDLRPRRSTATGRTSATSTSSARRTSTRSTGGCSSTSRASGFGGTSGWARVSSSTESRPSRGRRSSGNCRIAQRRVGRRVLGAGAGVTLRDGARAARASSTRRRTSAAAPSSRARSSAACATSATTPASTRASRSATR